MIWFFLYSVLSVHSKVLPIIKHQINNQLQPCTPLNNNTNNAISLYNCNQNYLYSISLGIGTPPQKINFQLDTGSDILWVSTSQTNPQGFNQESSSSIFISNQTYDIYYLKGYAKGIFGIDIISMLNTSISTDLQFLLANNVSQGIQPDGVLGIMGMGFTKTQNFLDAAWKNGQISTNTFTLSLNRPSDESYLYFDDIPQSISSETEYIPVFNQSYWSGYSKYFTSTEIDLSQYASNLAVFDSGTTNIFFNSLLYNAIYSHYFEYICQLDYYGQPICQCPIQLGGNAQWPTFAMAISNIQLYLPPESYVADIEGTCYLKIFSSTIDQLLLGDIIFRQYNITFNKQQKQVGFQGNLSVLNENNINFFIYSQFILFGIIGILLFYGLALIIILQLTINSQDLKYGKIVQIGQIYKLHSIPQKQNKMQNITHQKDQGLNNQMNLRNTQLAS